MFSYECNHALKKSGSIVSFGKRYKQRNGEWEVLFSNWKEGLQHKMIMKSGVIRTLFKSIIILFPNT